MYAYTVYLHNIVRLKLYNTTDKIEIYINNKWHGKIKWNSILSILIVHLDKNIVGSADRYSTLFENHFLVCCFIFV